MGEKVNPTSHPKIDALLSSDFITEIPALTAQLSQLIEDWEKFITELNGKSIDIPNYGSTIQHYIDIDNLWNL